MAIRPTGTPWRVYLLVVLITVLLFVLCCLIAMSNHREPYPQGISIHGAIGHSPLRDLLSRCCLIASRTRRCDCVFPDEALFLTWVAL